MRRILVFRHGIAINRYFMLGMERYFLRRGYEVKNRSYPSTRKFIEDHARDLSEELATLTTSFRLSGEPFELSLVTHSMGGLVLRYALSHFAMPPLHRAVLLVPPNNGSATARAMRWLPPYRWIWGQKAGAQLASDNLEFFGRCGVPSGFPVGIIAGNVRWKLLPHRLEKPHDGVVTLEEAKLPPLPLKVLPHGHTPILFSRHAWEEVEYFLQNGRFREATEAADHD